MNKKEQDILRKQVKEARKNNNWLFYSDLADFIEITDNSFYNWLNGSYELSYKKYKQLQGLITDLADS